VSMTISKSVMVTISLPGCISIILVFKLHLKSFLLAFFTFFFGLSQTDTILKFDQTRVGIWWRMMMQDRTLTKDEIMGAEYIQMDCY